MSIASELRARFRGNFECQKKPKDIQDMVNIR